MSSTFARLIWKRRGRVIPADLAAVISLVLLTDLMVFLSISEDLVVIVPIFTDLMITVPNFNDIVVVLPIIGDFTIRAVLGIAFVLFLPGYAIVSLLFPEADRPSITDDTDETRASITRFFRPDREEEIRRIDGVERMSLSFALSLAIVPLLMVGLSVSPFEFSLVPISMTISAFTIVCAGIAVIRRWAIPENQRYRVPYKEWIAFGKSSIMDSSSRQDVALNVALAAVILIAVGSLAVAVIAPPDGERFTEFYVLTENDSGELVAMHHPDSLSPDEPESLFIGIENYEQESIEYSVVVQLQRVENGTVTDRVELDRFSTTLAHNETFIQEKNLTVSDDITGESLRLAFLVYNESVPETPTRENAYLTLHLWVDVETEAQQ